jgi:hypothetical protein
VATVPRVSADQILAIGQLATAGASIGGSSGAEVRMGRAARRRAAGQGKRKPAPAPAPVAPLAPAPLVIPWGPILLVVGVLGAAVVLGRRSAGRKGGSRAR